MLTSNLYYCVQCFIFALLHMYGFASLFIKYEAFRYFSLLLQLVRHYMEQ